MAVRGSKVWDLPIRLFHWLLVVLMALSWWSAENDAMDWHYRAGLAVCALVVFRVAWGVMGSSTARFAHFVKGPRAVLAHLRGRAPKSVGDNPLGGWSVVAMLAAIASQVTLGLFAVDTDGIESGPLSYLVTFDQGRIAAEFHEMLFNMLLALIGLHVMAIAFYLLAKRRNLIGAMITGRRASADHIDVPPVPIWRLVIAVAIAAGTTYLVSTGFAWLSG